VGLPQSPVNSGAGEFVEGLVNGARYGAGLEPKKADSVVAHVRPAAGWSLRAGPDGPPQGGTVLVVGRGIDPRTSRFSGARSTN
jgi:hypothetical protein